MSWLHRFTRYFETAIFPGLAITQENPGLYAYGPLVEFVRAVSN